jgi:ABC-type dipeptide/oligopeptide/nickel transport system permease component
MGSGQGGTGILWLLLRRLVLMVPILFGIITVTFIVTRIIPGDPAFQIAGAFAGTELVESIQEQLGTNRPIWDQYIDYLSGVIRLDLGNSIFTGNPVTEDLADRLPATLFLIGTALTFALIVGVAAGAFAARRRNRTADRSVRATSFFVLSLPDFWLGLLLLYVFFFRLGWAPPPIGQLGPNDPEVENITGAAVIDAILTANAAGLKAAVGHAALPILTLGIIYAAPIARLTRSAMVESLDADYIRFGRACGLPSFTLWRYAVRSSLPPVVTFAGILFSVLIGGAVLVETVFSWGGAAQYAATAIKQNDFPAIQGFVLVSGVISVLIFLIVDLLYVAIDRRVKL